MFGLPFSPFRVCSNATDSQKWQRTISRKKLHGVCLFLVLCPQCCFFSFHKRTHMNLCVRAHQRIFLSRGWTLYFFSSERQKNMVTKKSIEKNLRLLRLLKHNCSGNDKTTSETTRKAGSMTKKSGKLRRQKIKQHRSDIVFVCCKRTKNNCAHARTKT